MTDSPERPDVARLAALLKICRDAGYGVEETATYLAACSAPLGEAPPTAALRAEIDRLHEELSEVVDDSVTTVSDANVPMMRGTPHLPAYIQSLKEREQAQHDTGVRIAKERDELRHALEGTAVRQLDDGSLCWCASLELDRCVGIYHGVPCEERRAALARAE